MMMGQRFTSRHAPEVVADAVTNIDVAAITQFEADTAGAASAAVTGTGTAGAPAGGTGPGGSNRGLHGGRKRTRAVHPWPAGTVAGSIRCWPSGYLHAGGHSHID